MACLTEFEYAMFADGELPDHETPELAEHLETCAPCRKLVAALRVESRVLVECFQSTDFIEFELEDETLSAPQAHNLSVVRFTAFVLAMSVVLRPVLSFLEELGLPDAVNWLAIGAAYVIPAGITLVDSVWSNASWIALSAILFLGLVLFSRRSLLTSSILSVLALLTVFSSSSYGLDIRPSNKPVTIPPGETVDDTLVVAAESVTVDGTVTGDLIAFVRQVTIRGAVKGNVISFARQIDVEGTVEGSIIGFGQSLETRGQVGRNVYAFGQSADIARGGRVGENVAIFASESDIEGTIGKDAYARVGSMNLSESARINGALTARVNRAENVRIAPGAAIGRTDIRTARPARSRYATLSFYVWQTIWLAAAFLTGLVLFWLFPGLTGVSFAGMRDLLISAGIGFLTFVALPIASVIAVITLIGLPLGLIALACWMAAAYAAKLVVAGFLGRSLLRNNSGGQPATALVLLVGLVPIFIATNLPYIGALIGFLLTLLGLGAIAMGIYEVSRRRSVAAA